MINIVFGLCGSGKTTTILDRIKQGALAGKRQMLIVPETKTFEMEKTVLGLFPSGGNPNVEVCSQTRLAQRILGDCIDFFVDKGGKALLVKKALAKSVSALKYYQKGTEKADFCQKLVEVFDELQASGVPAEKLYQSFALHEQDNLFDIATIFTAYEKELSDMGPDQNKQLNMAADCVKDSAFFDGVTIYFDNFSGFTYGELALIEEIGKKADDLYFSMLTDGKDSLFHEQNRTISRLCNIAENIGQQAVKIPADFKGKQEDIAHLSNLYSFDTTPFDGRVTHVRQVICDSMYEECMFVAAEIRRLALTQGIRYSHITVVSGDVEGYEPILANACYMQDVPLFVSDKTKILSKPVMLACIGALRAVQYQFNYESMFAFLKTGLFNLESDLCDRLENYVLAFKIRGNAWNKEWKRPQVDYGTTPRQEDYDALEQINQARREVITPLWRLKEQLSAAKVGKDYIEALMAYLEEIGFEALLLEEIKRYSGENHHREAQEYGQIYQTLLDGAQQFLHISQEDAMSGTEFIELFSLVLSGYSVAAIPGSVDQITLTAFRNLPSTHPQVVFLIGCSDTTLPPSGGGNSLISEAERLRLKDVGIALSLTAEERQIELESHIYRTFTCTSQYLYTTFSKQDRKGNEQGQSYLFERMNQLLPTLETERTADMNKAYLLGSERTIATLACLGLSGNESSGAKVALDYQLAKGAYLAIGQTQSRGPITDTAIIKGLYGQQLSLSASRIERINSCPFSYFMEYGLKAKPRQKIDLDARVVGSFLHEIVEKTIKAYVADPKCHIGQAIEQSAMEYIEKITKTDQVSARLKVILANIVKNAHSIIQNIIEEIESSEFKPVFCEFAFGKDGDVPAYSFKKGEITVSVQGKIDRVDAYVKGERLYLKVVDYKSGQKSFSLSDLLYGLNVQMFLYLMMLSETKTLAVDDNCVQREAAAVLYVPLRNQYTKAFAEDEDEGEGKKREGYVLEDMDILEALEKPVDNKFRYLPVGIKKDGNFTAASSVLSAVDFGKIFKKLKRDLDKLAEGLLAGNVETNPYRNGLTQTSCDWCPYHMACQFDESNNRDKMRVIRRLSKAQTLEEMGEEA